MAFEGIDSFIGNLTYGGARPNLYQVSVGSSHGVGSNIVFRCKATTLPGKQVGNTELFYMGQKYNLPGDTTFDGTWSVTVILDEGLETYKQLLAWQDKIRSADGNSTSDNVIRNHYEDATITTYKKDTSEDITMVLHHVWPQNIAEITLDWSQQNSIMEVQVTFQYTWHELA